VVDSDRSADQPRAAGRFDTVLRGYDRAQVDAHLARLTEENSALRRQATEADRRRRAAEQHAAAAEGEFRRLQSQRPGASPPETVGFRAEKLLRLAEQEAADLRAAAAEEAAALVGRAEMAAESERLRATQEARQLREQARQDVARLTSVQRDVRSDLARLADALAVEVGVLEAYTEAPTHGP